MTGLEPGPERAEEEVTAVHRAVIDCAFASGARLHDFLAVGGNVRVSVSEPVDAVLRLLQSMADDGKVREASSADDWT